MRRLCHGYLNRSRELGAFRGFRNIGIHQYVQLSSEKRFAETESIKRMTRTVMACFVLRPVITTYCASEN